MRTSLLVVAHCGTFIACTQAGDTDALPPTLLGESQGVALVELNAQLDCELTGTSEYQVPLRLAFDIDGDTLRGSVRMVHDTLEVLPVAARREGKAWVFEDFVVSGARDDWRLEDLTVVEGDEVTASSHAGTVSTVLGDINQRCDVQSVDGTLSLDTTAPLATLVDPDNPRTPYEVLHIDFDEPVNADSLELSVYDDATRSPIKVTIERVLDEARWLRAMDLVAVEGWAAERIGIELKHMENEGLLLGDAKLTARVSLQSLPTDDYGFEQDGVVWDGCEAAEQVSPEAGPEDVQVSAPEGTRMLVCWMGGGYMEQALSVPKDAEVLRLQTAIFDTMCQLNALEPTMPTLLVRSSAGERSIPLSAVISEDVCSTGFQTERIELTADERERIWLGVSFNSGAIPSFGLGAHRLLLIDDLGFE